MAPAPTWRRSTRARRQRSRPGAGRELPVDAVVDLFRGDLSSARCRSATTTQREGTEQSSSAACSRYPPSALGGGRADPADTPGGTVNPNELRTGRGAVESGGSSRPAGRSPPSATAGGPRSRMRFLNGPDGHLPTPARSSGRLGDEGLGPRCDQDPRRGVASPRRRGQGTLWSSDRARRSVGADGITRWRGLIRRWMYCSATVRSPRNGLRRGSARVW